MLHTTELSSFLDHVLLGSVIACRLSVATFLPTGYWHAVSDDDALVLAALMHPTS